MRLSWSTLVIFLGFFYSVNLCAQEYTALLCADGIDNDGDGLIDCEDPGCTGIPNDGCSTCFESGISFADIVYEYSPGCPGMLPEYTNPVEALGIANYRGPPPSGLFVALGEQGVLKLGFLNNLVINGGDSDPDVWVFEIGPAVEPTTVSLRPHDDDTRSALVAAGLLDDNGDDYYLFDAIAGATSSLDIDAYVPGYAEGELKFNAIELVDDLGTVCFGTGNAGADIDAVCALSTEFRELCDNGLDDDEDGLIDCDDPDIQPLCCCYEDPMIVIDYDGCIDDGYEIEVNNEVYNQLNPYGVQNLLTPAGCDSTLIIDLRFHSDTSYSEVFVGCSGDGYTIAVNGVVYDEENPEGRESMQTIYGCDSIVDVNLFFGEYSDTDVEYIGCQGDGYDTIVNGTHYNESNQDGIEFMINEDGCDSSIAVFLRFLPTYQDTFRMQSCVEDSFSIQVGVDLYDINNRSGSSVLPSTAGCDSTLYIELNYYEDYYIAVDTTICDDEFFELAIGQKRFNINNPSGRDTLYTQYGCDSIFSIDLRFTQSDTVRIFEDRCTADGFSVVVNGMLYDETNPEGIEPISRAESCDSIVIISLQFFSVLRDTINYTGCEGDGFEVIVNNVVFNEDNISGEETILSSIGCDSTVSVDLVFHPRDTQFYSYSGCRGDGFNIEIGAEIFNEDNPIGEQIVYNQYGCDSLIQVELIFADTFYQYINEEHCVSEDYSLTVNGMVYDINNSSGVESMMSSEQCDSTIQIQLNYIQGFDSLITYLGCIDDGYEIIVNGQAYNENNPVGREEMISSQGCDSIVRIELSFVFDIVYDLDYEGCVGDGHFEIVNNVRYDEQNPTGQEIISLGGNCDSIVNVNLVFLDELTGEEIYLGCRGDRYEVVVNGIVYNETNSSGLETLRSVRGCDSIVTIDLQFFNELSDTLRYSGCEGDLFSVVVGATVYNQYNPRGQERLSSSCACDSLIIIDFKFEENDLYYSEYNGCSGDDYFEVINGVRYDESNPIGEESIARLGQCDSLVYVLFTYADCPDPCDGSSIFLPNIFTPNEDGLNDTYGPLFDSRCDVRIENWSIYNRYGGKVYTALGTQSWDGRVEGAVVNAGVYVVVCEYVIDGIHRTLAAYVTVIY